MGRVRQLLDPRLPARLSAADAAETRRPSKSGGLSRRLAPRKRARSGSDRSPSPFSPFPGSPPRCRSPGVDARRRRLSRLRGSRSTPRCSRGTLVGAGLDELAAPVRCFRVPAGVEERSHLVPQLGGMTLDRVGQPDPVVTARVVARLRRRRERRIAERADRDDDQVRLRRFRVEDLRAAVGAEVEDVLLSVRLVRDSRGVAEAAGDLHLIRFESGLHPEGASGPALAGETVADGDGEADRPSTSRRSCPQ